MGKLGRPENGGTSWSPVRDPRGECGRVAAEADSRVLLPERAAIPRYQTRGGGLSGCSQELLPPNLGVTRDDLHRSAVRGPDDPRPAGPPSSAYRR